MNQTIEDMEWEEEMALHDGMLADDGQVIIDEEPLTDVITKEIMQQYEMIRANGACNMLDRRCVQKVADLAGFYDLASLTDDEYGLILKHYSELMEHYGIQRLETQRARQ